MEKEVKIRGTVFQEVLIDPSISKSAKALYALLSTYRNRYSNQAWPSNEDIGSALGSDRQDIRKWFKELESAGAISIEITKVHRQNVNRRIITFKDGYETSDEKSM